MSSEMLQRAQQLLSVEITEPELHRAAVDRFLQQLATQAPGSPEAVCLGLELPLSPRDSVFAVLLKIRYKLERGAQKHKDVSRKKHKEEEDGEKR